MDLRAIQNLANAWQRGGQTGDPIIPINKMQGYQNAGDAIQINQSQSLQADPADISTWTTILKLVQSAQGIKIPDAYTPEQIAQVIAQWYPYLSVPPNVSPWPTATMTPEQMVIWIEANMGSVKNTPYLQQVVNAAIGYVNAFQAIPYLPWDKVPWAWLNNGGWAKIATAFQNTPGAITDGLNLIAQIAMIPAGTAWQSGVDPSNALQLSGADTYAPPNFLAINWNDEPYKSIVSWFQGAGQAIATGANYWPLVYWVVTDSQALAHVKNLPLMSQDIACYTDPTNGIDNFKAHIVKDPYDQGWCAKSPGPGPDKNPPNCAATGQDCSDALKCCDGSCTNGKCAAASSNTIWWVLGGVGLVAVVGAGLLMTGGGAKANPCPCEARNPRERGLSNADREQWIDNDEGLYSWWKSSRQSKREFIKENKTEIDAAINGVLHAPPRQSSWRGY